MKKFAIITHTIHKIRNHKVYAYEPYVREMNLWFNYVKEVKVVAPISNKAIENNEALYLHSKLEIKNIPPFDVLSFKNAIKSVFKIPYISIKIFKAMQWADHIHLRCPGNIGLLGCFIQILFPKKPKTIKYAGNWDANSKQPWSYKLQKWIISNTFLTKNCKVLVYGNWDNQSKNIVPFFTASYSNVEKEIMSKTIAAKNKPLQLIFVGAFTKGKQPLLAVKTVKQLKEKGHQVHLNMYGDGNEKQNVVSYIKKNNLNNEVTLHGNVNQQLVKEGFKKAHFLIFISQSEGWPKVVAEAMFWGCVPITSKVSCVPMMVDNGSRGKLVSTDAEAVNAIENYINNPNEFRQHSEAAQQWSQNYTIEKFDAEIGKVLNSFNAK